MTLIALYAQEGHRTSGQSWLDSRKQILLRMKTAYLRHEGPDKLQQVRRESRTGHLISRTLSLSLRHTQYPHTTFPRTKLPAQTKLRFISQHFVSHFLFFCYPHFLCPALFTHFIPPFLSLSPSCLCIDVEWCCRVISVSFNQNPLYNCLAGGPEVDLLSSQLSFLQSLPQLNYLKFTLIKLPKQCKIS